MGSVKDYFSSLGTGIASLIKGMQVTGKELVTRKITEEYPDNRLDSPAAPRFRAELKLIYDAEGNHKCIACGTCERNCPNGTIKIESKMVDTLTGKKKKLDRYVYDLGSCTFCQARISFSSVFRFILNGSYSKIRKKRRDTASLELKCRTNWI